MKRRNRISGQWSPRLIEMLESPAYRVLSLSAHRVISRVEVELAHHGGNDNGRLPVPVNDFVDYGVDRASVAPAIREAEALGFIRVTQRGRGGNADHRTPNLFYLTFAPGRESRAQPPSHDWRKIETVEEAVQIARAARAAKDFNAVEQGIKRWRRRQRKQNAGAGKHHPPVGEIHTEDAGPPVRETHTTGPVRKPALLSISRGGGGVRSRRAPRLVEPSS
jgi:hypothetical protein